MSRSPICIVARSIMMLSLFCLLDACGGGGSTSSGVSVGSGSGGVSTSPGTVDVLTYHNDNMRTGQNLAETTLTPANVNSSTFGLLRILPADNPVDATPLIASQVSIAGALHDVVYFATEHDSVYAYDADTGALLAQVSLLASGETPSDTRNCGQVEPEIGVTATPVIDRSIGPNGTLFVVAMSVDSSGVYYQRLHALDLTTLADRQSAVAIQASAAGTGNTGTGVQSFDPKQYKERGALLALNGQVYTVWASHCDSNPYNGWIIAYDESTLAQTAVLNYTPNGEGGAIWDVAGLAADTGGTVYGMAGNGTFDTTLTGAGFPSQADYGNAVLKLTAGSALTVADYYTAPNTVSESAQDIDLGSGSPLLLPDQTDGSGNTRHLLIGAGKDGNILLLDRDNLGKFNASVSAAYQLLSGALSGGLFSAFAYFNGNVYVADVGGTLKAFSLAQAQLSASPTSQSAISYPYPGSSPAVSANGSSNAILWAVVSSPAGAAQLHAYNPANLAQEYYNSTQAGNSRDAFGNGEKYITPVIANGKVLVGTPNGVAIFGLL